MRLDKIKNSVEFKHVKKILKKYKIRIEDSNKKILRYIYGEIDNDELYNLIKNVGINEGDILFVQSSYKDLFSLSSTPLELINILKSIIGEKGTLFMPAYNYPKDNENWIFDINSEPTNTGIINEIFRREKDVIRSLHPRHSICGYGLHAKIILSDHEKCKYADGENSPFDKMKEYHNSKILTLGLPKGFISFLHWIEDISPESLPFQVHNDTPNEYKYYDVDGSIKVIKDYRLRRDIVENLNLEKVSNKLPNESYTSLKYKGVKIYLYDMHTLAQNLLQLRDNGIIHYN